MTSLENRQDLSDSRRLSVSDTLAQATKALQTHRDWMQRRISAITPLDEDEDHLSSLFEKRLAWEEGRETSKCAGNGLVVNGEDSDAGIQEDDVQAAPPPFQLQSGSGSGKEWINYLKQKKRFAKVAPLDSLSESEEGPQKPVETVWGSHDMINTTDSMREPSRAQGDEKPSSDETEEAVTTVKRRKVSKAAVTPSDAIIPNGASLPGKSATPSELFLSPPPTSVASMNAWGSLTLLDKESVSSPGRGSPGHGSPGRGSPDTTVSSMTLEDVTTEGVVARSAIVHPKQQQQQQQQQEAGKPPEPPKSLQQPLEHGLHFTDDNTSDDHEDSFEHNIEALQSASSATVVPVSPAPKEQRSSYSLHSQSKLSMAEAGLEFVNTSPDGGKTLGGVRTPRRDTRVPSSAKRTGGKSIEVPEAILQPVLPMKRERKIGASVIVHKQPPSEALQKPESLSGTTSSEANTSFGDHKPQHGGIATVRVPPTSSPSQSYYPQENLPPLKEPGLHSIDGSVMVKQLPPLKLQSPSTPTLLTARLSRKRERAPPIYAIHKPYGGMALAPACPAHGVQQPRESEVLKSIRRWNSQSDSTSPIPSTSTSPRPSMSAEPGSTDQTATEQSGFESNLKSLLSSSITRQGSEQTRQTDHPSERSSLPPESPATPILRQQQQLDSLSISEMPTGPGPLHLAAKSGNLRRLQSLINQGHDVDMPDHEGKTPIMYCIHSKGVHISCADVLIREGANLNKQSSDGSTATHLAAFVGAVSLIELMLLNGANPDIKDFDGRLPLHWGTTPVSHRCLDVLLKHSNLDLNVTDDAGMTPLMWAAYHNNPTIIAYLLDHGADCEEKDMDGYTTMHWAVHKEGVKCLEMLLKPDMTYFKDHKGRTVMHHATEKGSLGSCELILKMRYDAIYDTDKMNRTPLHYAAACSRVDVCALLLDRGCDASQGDIFGRTPLQYARMKKLDYIVALLTCHGTAVADFARASRSTSVVSILNRAASFSQLPLETTDTTSILSESWNSLGGEIDSAHQILAGGEEKMDTARGAYLGRFTSDRNDPLQHFFFWLKPDSGTICWSRESSKKTHKETRVLEVHKGPSNALRNSSVYSPTNELHKYVFWVLTDIGALDLLAYNEEAYVHWLNEMGKLAQTMHHSRPQSAQSLPIMQETSSPTLQGGSLHGSSDQGWTENTLIFQRPSEGMLNSVQTEDRAADSSFHKLFPFSRKTQVQPLTSTPCNAAAVSHRNSFEDDVI